MLKVKRGKMKELYEPLEIEIIRLSSGSVIENSDPQSTEHGEDPSEIDTW